MACGFDLGDGAQHALFLLDTETDNYGVLDHVRVFRKGNEFHEHDILGQDLLGLVAQATEGYALGVGGNRDGEIAVDVGHRTDGTVVDDHAGTDKGLVVGGRDHGARNGDPFAGGALLRLRRRSRLFRDGNDFATDRILQVVPENRVQDFPDAGIPEIGGNRRRTRRIQVGGVEHKGIPGLAFHDFKDLLKGHVAEIARDGLARCLDRQREENGKGQHGFIAHLYGICCFQRYRTTSRPLRTRSGGFHKRPS